MSPTERQEIKDMLHKKILQTEEAIAELVQLTKPISPENAIGRISRMDAINNRSVNVAALREAEQRIIKLKKALTDIDSPHFGICKKCGADIQLGRLKFRPESAFCMHCVQK